MLGRVGVLGCVVISVAGVFVGASPAFAQGPASASAPTVLVHVDAPRPVTLETLDQDDRWTAVCTSPCERQVPVDAAYRVTGDGMRNSKTFHLDPVARMTLTVDPTSSSARAIAVVVTVLGSIGLLPIAGVTAFIVAGEILGAIIICPFAAAFETVKSQQGAEYGDCLSGVAGFFSPAYAQPIVWVPAIAGGALLTGGIVGLVGTPRTGVRSTPPAPPVSSAPLPPTLEALRLPRPAAFPVLAVRF
jgi:hypothetical protein